MLTYRRGRLWLLTVMVMLPVMLLGAPDHLYMSELVLFPSQAEYVAITNPTSQSIQLGDYYLTDATDTVNGKSASNRDASVYAYLCNCFMPSEFVKG